MECRRANNNELSKINTLIRASKGYWQYSEEFLDKFMIKWGVTQQYLDDNPIFIYEDKTNFIGLYSFSYHNGVLELDNFFIDPNFIGKGHGRLLWAQVLEYAGSMNWGEFQLISDPNAEAFYTHVGCVKIDTLETFPGRFVPVMRYQLS